MKLKIKVLLKSDLCAGSGESLGNRVDNDICTDSFGLPYIPARRLKGCLREAADELNKMKHPLANDESIDSLFGNQLGKPGVFSISDAVLDASSEIHSWIIKNRKGRSDNLRKAIHPERLSRIFSYRRGQTRLEKGMKVDGTLRYINVLKHYNPMVQDGDEELAFYSTIELSGGQDSKVLLEACIKTLRHIGMNRNRGLGNVVVSIVGEEQEKSDELNAVMLADDKRYYLEYKIALDSPLTLPECDDIRTSIPARSIIGAMARIYLEKHEKDDAFDTLFLNGETKWSELTPVIQGRKSYPVPLMVVKLKNGEGKLLNRFGKQKDDNWKSLKPKTLDSGYMVKVEKDGADKCKYFIADVPLRTVYHNSIKGRKENGTGLYMQSSIDGGYIYSGSIDFSGRMYERILELLGSESLFLGRSRTAQYSSCHILSLDEKPIEVKDCTDVYSDGQPIYLIAKSDIVLPGTYGTLSKETDIRGALSEILNVNNTIPEGKMDLCSYLTVGGFNNMWNLQKPHMQVIKAGSVFCFTAKEKEYSETVRISSYQQEGFGYCSLVSQEKMEEIFEIENSTVDRVEIDINKCAETVESFKSMALANLCAEYISDNAERIAKEIRNLKGKTVEANKKRRGVPEGRMRLLLAEASDYKDLRDKVDDIKESDCDSETIGRKWECHELLDKLYGTDHKKMTVETMIGKDNKEILDELDEGTKNRICSEWKKYLDIVLHSLHYSKGGNR